MKNQKNIIILLIPILILTIAWVIFSVYHSFINSTIDVPLAKDIKPIKGSFDIGAIEQLKTRVRVESNNDILLQIEDNQNTSSPSSNLDSEFDESDDFEFNDGTGSAELDDL